MSKEYRHLVFYDGECGFCDQVVQFILKADQKKRFAFAPLQGKTAAKWLENLPESVKTADSVILIENYQEENSRVSLYGKAAFRILWLLGGAWRLIGWKAYLPACLYNWAYRLVARNRKRLFPQTSCVVPSADEKERFLP